MPIYWSPKSIPEIKGMSDLEALEICRLARRTMRPWAQVALDLQWRVGPFIAMTPWFLPLDDLWRWVLLPATIFLGAFVSYQLLCARLRTEVKRVLARGTVANGLVPGSDDFPETFTLP